MRTLRSVKNLASHFLDSMRWVIPNSVSQMAGKEKHLRILKRPYAKITILSPSSDADLVVTSDIRYCGQDRRIRVPIEGIVGFSGNVYLSGNEEFAYFKFRGPDKCRLGFLADSLLISGYPVEEGFPEGYNLEDYFVKEMP